jgi:hypothetical protein
MTPFLQKLAWDTLKKEPLRGLAVAPESIQAKVASDHRIKAR